MSISSYPAQAIAKAFTDARNRCAGLPDYPGPLPQTLEQAYAIQDAAIALWPHKIAGWKIGGIGEPYASKVGETKLAGPVYENQIYYSKGDLTYMPVFAAGFTAVEPEIVLFVKKDAPEGKVEWTVDEAREYVGAAHIGVEIASSPFPDINNVTPFVTISDFGCNNGLLIGEALTDWDSAPLDRRKVETVIDDDYFGPTSPPGPLLSFRFILGNTAARGMPLKKGMAITTGAITGVHQAFAGQSSTVKCSDVADMNFALVPAE